MMTSLISQDSGYLDHLGLSHNPFPVVPDDASIFLSQRIEQIVVEIVHGVAARKGFMILTGDIGLGKTTISRRIISILGEKGIETALVLHTSLQDAELLQEINRDFGVNPSRTQEENASLGEQLRQLNQFLLEQNRQGKNCAIIIDDAQNLNQQSLELVRMISNLEGDRQKLVQILLVGQPELAERLNTHGLRQLRSRVVITAEARPLSRQELKAYIHFKLNSAGNHGQASVTSWAVHHIYHYTRGNFRLVNMLMDRCLYVACLQNLRVITLNVVRIAHKDLFPRSKVKMARLLAAVIVPTVIFGGILCWYFSSHGEGGLSAFGLKFSWAQSSDPSTQEAAKDAADQLPQDPLRNAVVKFLKPFQLERYAEKFQRALSSGKMEGFTATLFQKTGYELIEFKQLPSGIQQNFGVLSIAADSAERQVHYILWRPPIQIKNFYYYYQGPEIKHLQSLLVKADLYHDKLDHIVGPRLMQAVVNFQKQNGLAVTGFPDSQTLFLLYHI